jgi:hypothetical protein
MSVPEGNPPAPEVEGDSRFPSGPWTGFFLQKGFAGRQWMELDLTFARGVLRGDGRDWVGTFLVRGRYDVETGKCSWTKRYVGQHDIAYAGYNEGRGIWGLWEDPLSLTNRGGFHIWPVSMGDPTQRRLTAEADAPAPVEAAVLEPATAGTP